MCQIKLCFIAQPISAEKVIKKDFNNIIYSGVPLYILIFVCFLKKKNIY